jgi:molybdenum cofactor biosynthesis enzyme MoaA
MIRGATNIFRPEWRHAKCRAFDLHKNSTAKATIWLDLWGQKREVYANANLSIYSGQACDGDCGFCVEKLRPASRGITLDAQKTVEKDDQRYFRSLDEVLTALKPLHPSVSITGGEPTQDARLPRVLQLLDRHSARKRTLTTNGTGLLGVLDGKPVLEWLSQYGVQHVNISIAHFDPARNFELMRLNDSLAISQLRHVVAVLKRANVRPRLSCVLVRGGIETFEGILQYLEFAGSLGVDNVIFRQLMYPDSQDCQCDEVARFCSSHRVALEPLLRRVTAADTFSFCRQVIGYYYYVEVWKRGEMNVAFEEADLGRLELVKTRHPELIHEMVFHPNAALCSTWQPWDGILGPRSTVVDEMRMQCDGSAAIYTHKRFHQ